MLFKPAQKAQPTESERELFWHFYGDDAHLLDSLYGTSYAEAWSQSEEVS